jgi:hypothetical protein
VEAGHRRRPSDRGLGADWGLWIELFFTWGLIDLGTQCGAIHSRFNCGPGPLQVPGFLLFFSLCFYAM